MLSKKEVEYIAKLARIGLNEEEKDKLSDNLSRILDYVNELREVNTEGVEPIAHITGLENALRADEHIQSAPSEVFTKDGPEAAGPQRACGQFPQKKDRYLKIPSVLKEY